MGSDLFIRDRNIFSNPSKPKILIKVIIYNHGGSDFVINKGDRIAQMILMPVIKMELEEAENLPETIRGEGGFGSTGK